MKSQNHYRNDTKNGKKQGNSKRITCQDPPRVGVARQRRVRSEKNNLSVQDKGNSTRTKSCKHHRRWTNKKTINVIRKSRYFNGRIRLIF